MSQIQDIPIKRWFDLYKLRFKFLIKIVLCAFNAEIVGHDIIIEE